MQIPPKIANLQNKKNKNKTMTKMSIHLEIGADTEC